MLASCVLSQCMVGWRLASVQLVFGCCCRGLGPQTWPTGAQAPAALAGWCQWRTWLFVCGPHTHDGKRSQCHSALDAALPCYASYGCVTKSCGFSCEHCGCYPPLRFCSLTFIALSHVHGESEAQGWVVRHHPEPCHWHTGLPCTQQG